MPYRKRNCSAHDVLLASGLLIAYDRVAMPTPVDWTL